jgi:hypothetical protein
MEQIISSLKPLPVRVFETPTTYVFGPTAEDDEPHAAPNKSVNRRNPMAFGHLRPDIANLLTNLAQIPPHALGLAALGCPAH